MQLHQLNRAFVLDFVLESQFSRSYKVRNCMFMLNVMLNVLAFYPIDVNGFTEGNC